MREERGIRWQIWRDGVLVACGCLRDPDVHARLDHFDHVVGLARLLYADLVLPV